MNSGDREVGQESSHHPGSYRDSIKSWIESAMAPRDGVETPLLNANLFSADLEGLAESSLQVFKRLQDLADETPSWDALETALYDTWSHLGHLQIHWRHLVETVGDEDLSLEGFANPEIEKW